MIINILLILLVIWSMLFTLSRFIKYFRIVKYYKNTAEATVISVSNHVPGRRKEPPAIDVTIEYDINGKTTHSEIVVPQEHAAKYEIGNKLDICYYVADNGAVHVASAGDGARKLMYGHLAALFLEIIVYVIIWIIVF